jgi:integrase
MDTRAKLQKGLSIEIVKQGLKENTTVSRQNKTLIIDFITYVQKYKPDTTDSTLTKIIYHLITISKWFNCDFDSITKDEFLRVRKALKNDEFVHITSTGKKVYSESSKVDYISDVKQICKWIWRQGNNKNKFEVIEIGKEKRKVPASFDVIFEGTYTANIDKEEEPLILPIEVIDYLINTSAKTIDMKFAVALSFCSGGRPQELWSAKKHDLTYDSKTGKYFLNIRFAKKSSSRRTVDLPLFQDIFKQYQAHILTLKDPEDSLLNIAYHYFRKWLRIQSIELAKRGLIPKGRMLIPYTFRHSSIQYFGGEVYQWNYTYLANRYGWAYSSVGDRLKDYISRSKVALPDASILARKDDFAKLKEENVSLSSKMVAIEQQMNEMAKAFASSSGHKIKEPYRHRARLK